MFEKVRNNNFKNYRLYSNYYFSAPPLSCDAMLNMKKVELDLFPEPVMFIAFEKCMRGGVS